MLLQVNPKGTQNERVLWHGTSADTVKQINTNGFNRSYCGKHGQCMCIALMHGHSLDIYWNPFIIVGSHIGDPCYKSSHVINDGHTSCVGQIKVKQVLKMLRKCLMHTDQYRNTCFWYFYVNLSKTWTLPVGMWYFEILGAKVYLCYIEISLIKGVPVYMYICYKPCWSPVIIYTQVEHLYG